MMNRFQPWSEIKLWGLGITALILMIVDHHFTAFHQARERLVFKVMTPIQLVIQAPRRFMWGIQDDLASRHHWRQANQQLKQENLQLEEKLHQLSPLKTENRQLRALLEAKSHYQFRAVAVEVIASVINRFSQTIVIDHGHQSGVVTGLPLVGPHGIVGQIVHVAANHSQVMLISDPNSRIPVMDTRNGFDAIAVGGGVGRPLTLSNVTITDQIRVGDHLVSSGLGQRYPKGYPVAIVTKVVAHLNNQMCDVLADPLADLRRNRELLLLFSTAATETLPPSGKPPTGLTPVNPMEGPHHAK